MYNKRTISFRVAEKRAKAIEKIESRAKRHALKRACPLLLRQRQRLDWNGRGHRSRPRAVALVNVRTELNDAVRRRPGGNIDPIDIHRLGELHVQAVARTDHRVDLIAAPARGVLQQP